MRSQVGKSMGLRSVPEVRFVVDEGAARGGRVLSLLSALRGEEGEAEGAAAAAVGAAAAAADSSGSDEDAPLLPYDETEEDVIDVR